MIPLRLLRSWSVLFLAIFLGSFVWYLAEPLWGQRPMKTNRPDSAGKNAEVVLPKDPRLLEIHKDFVQKAEKLAGEYERSKNIEKARVVYEEILRLVPGLPSATQALAKIKSQEANAEQKNMDVFANRGWQDSGVEVIPGKPISIQASGEWQFKMSYNFGPEGIAIPEELRDFNLGSLIGVISGGDPKDTKPFFIGAEKEFVFDRPGKLMLRMYDADPSDNSGKIAVEIHGTFNKR